MIMEILVSNVEQRMTKFFAMLHNSPFKDIHYMDLTGFGGFLLLKRIFQSTKDSKCPEARRSVSLNTQSLPQSWPSVSVW